MTSDLWYNWPMRFLAVMLALAAVTPSAVFADEEIGFYRWYAGAAGGMSMPGSGNTLRRAGAVAVRGGWYASEFTAFEIEGLCAPNMSSGVGNTTLSAVSARGVFHMTGWDAFDKLFGCERFDPFLTAGVTAHFASRHAFADGDHRTGIGPAAGLGAFWHITDSISLRVDASATLCVDSPCGMMYGVFAGIQVSLGGGTP